MNTKKWLAQLILKTCWCVLQWNVEVFVQIRDDSRVNRKYKISFISFLSKISKWRKNVE